MNIEWKHSKKFLVPQTIVRPVLLSASLFNDNIYVFLRLVSVDTFIGKNGWDTNDLFFWWTSPSALLPLSPYRMISLILTGFFTILFGLFRSIPSCWESERLTDTRRRSFMVSLVFINVCKQNWTKIIFFFSYFDHVLKTKH